MLDSRPSNSHTPPLIAGGPIHDPRRGGARRGRADLAPAFAVPKPGNAFGTDGGAGAREAIPALARSELVSVPRRSASGSPRGHGRVAAGARRVRRLLSGR